MIKKRLFSILLCCCMMLTLLPVTASAEDTDAVKAIQLGTGSIRGYDSSTGYDYIYFGNWIVPDGESSLAPKGPIKWRVLDTKTNMDEATEGDGLFLLSDVLMGTKTFGEVRFHYSSHYDEKSGKYFKGSDHTSISHTNCLDLNAWQESDAQKWCNTFYTDNLTRQEQNAVLATTKSDKAFTSSTTYKTPFAASENILNEDKVFFLSAEEVENKDYGFINNDARIANYGSSAARWWLRSPYAYYNPNAGVVYEKGILYYETAGVNNAARPALNLDSSDVLFISPAENSGNGNDLEAVGTYTGNEWKLTLKDSSRSFSANVNGQAGATVSVGSSMQITYSGAQTGSNEYVSVLLCDSNDNVLYYGNIAQSGASGTASVRIPADLALGNYTLKVFNEQCNGDYKTDYASDFQNIDLNVVLPQETTPSTVFTATNNNSGTLSGVDTSMKYSVDGGTTWNDITGETMEITGVTAEQDVKVYKQGNGTTTSDSEVQTIDITQAAQPTGIDKADCTTSQQNNGQITGVDTTMEYKLSTGSEWTTIDANPLTGLTDGTYEVRVKASGTVLASVAATVTIGAHTCVAQGDWQYDETSHWELCVCGAKVEEAAHSGGEATCTASAACEVCGQPYGAKNPSHHTGKASWITTETTHTKVYSCCQTIIEAETAHIWENGKCTVCQYDCEHQGGTATCSQLAQCEICESLYGNYDPNNHKAAEAWTQENGKHYHICEYGCDTHLDETDCSGGTATCTALAVCETCLQTYGLLNPNNHTDTTEWIQTATMHTQKYKCCGAVVVAEENHEWENGVCTECDYECVHQYNWQSESGMYWQHCTICGFDTNKKAIPTINISGSDKVCRTQDYKFSFTLPEGATDAAYGYEFIGLGDGPLTPTVENNLYSGIIKASIYPAEETGFKLIVSAKTSDGFEFSAEKTVTIQNEHTGGTATCKEKAKCEVCGESYGELDVSNHADMKHIDAKAATKTAEGNIEYWSCEGCNKYYKDAKATQEITKAQTVTAKLLKENDSDKSPQTGDNSNLALWIALLLVSGGTVTVTTVVGRKKRSVK